MADSMRQTAAEAAPNAVFGSGILGVGGSVVAILHSVSYDSDVKLYEQILGYRNGQVAFRQALSAVASLKAEYADVRGNLALFTANSQSIPTSGLLPVYSATFTGDNGTVIVFGECNIIPGNAKMQQGEWVVGNVEIRSIHGLPSIYDGSEASGGTWSGGTGGTLSGLTYTIGSGVTLTIPSGQTFVAPAPHVVLGGRIVCEGRFSIH